MRTLAQTLLIKSEQSPVRLMGFREWCEKVYEPSMMLREERRLMLKAQRLNKDQGTVHGQH